MIEDTDGLGHVEDDVESDRRVAVLEPADGVPTDAGTLRDLLDRQLLQLPSGAEMVAEFFRSSSDPMGKWSHGDS